MLIDYIYREIIIRKLGLGNQTQMLSRHIEQANVVAIQNILDKLGRTVIKTLPVPVEQQTINYIDGIIADEAGNKYDFNDFDADVNNPNRAKTISEYYSNNNNDEPYVPSAEGFPYSRIEYSKTEPGKVRRTATAGKYHRMGAGHELSSYTAPAAEEELAPYAVDDGTNRLIDSRIEYKDIMKQIVIEEDQDVLVTYTTSDGRVIATCSGNSDNTYRVEKKYNYDIGYIDIHIPTKCVIKDNHEDDMATWWDIIDLTNDIKITEDYPVPALSNLNLSEGFYRFIYRGSPDPDDLAIEYELNYGDFSFYIYDKNDHLVKTWSPKAVKEQNGFLTEDHSYNAMGRLTSTTSPDGGYTTFFYNDAGNIRFSVNSEQYKNNAFSYTNYDDAGRIIEAGEYHCPDGNCPDLETKTDNPYFYMDDNYRYHQRFVKYDLPDNSVNPYHNVKVTLGYLRKNIEGLSDYKQKYTLGRISRTWNDESTTWYSYTYHNTIDWVVKYIHDIDKIITIDYEHDPMIGALEKIIYQKNTPEEYVHIYNYDKDTRLKEVYTQYEGDEKKLQARYEFYKHGPIKRKELADSLQGIDYIYTINGWLKSINNPGLGEVAENNPLDPGDDGFEGRNNHFCKDIFGMTLDYHMDDYLRKGTHINYGGARMGNENFNGSISALRWKLSNSTLQDKYHNCYLYYYDNRNQLTKTEFGTYYFVHYDVNSNDSYAGAYSMNKSNDPYGTRYQYDDNGNITSIKRKDQYSTVFDDMAYTYKPNTNMLEQINETASDIPGYDEIKSGTWNYDYNDIGQLISKFENNKQMNFAYNPYGLITKCTDGSNNMIGEYKYDEKGFRIKKIDYSNPGYFTETWYVRDPGGNVIAIYKRENLGDIKQAENSIIGTGRMGSVLFDENGNIDRYVYEIKDYLGNVRAVIARDENNPDIPEILTTQDYFPYGMPMTGRMKNPDDYRYAYQGDYAEKDQETGSNHFHFRNFDSKTARWQSKDVWGQFFSSYIGMGNNPVNFVDPDGGYIYIAAYSHYFHTTIKKLLMITKTFADKELQKIFIHYENSSKNHLVFLPSESSDVVDQGGALITKNVIEMKGEFDYSSVPKPSANVANVHFVLIHTAYLYDPSLESLLRIAHEMRHGEYWDFYFPQLIDREIHHIKMFNPQHYFKIGIPSNFWFYKSLSPVKTYKYFSPPGPEFNMPKIPSITGSMLNVIKYIIPKGSNKGMLPCPSILE